MRALFAWIVGLYAAGIGVADRVAFPSGASALGSGISLAVFALAALTRRSRRLGTPLLALAAACAGATSLQRELERARGALLARDFEGIADARVRSRSLTSGAVELVLDEVSVLEPAALRIPERVALRLARSDASPLLAALPGESWRLALRLRSPPRERNPGGRDLERRLARAGIGAIARLREPALAVRVPERDRGPLRARIEAAREALAGALLGLGAGGGLLLALAIGDRRGIDPRLGDAFAELGLSHLVAVSGLNVGVAAAATLALVFALLRRSAWLAARCDPREPALAAAFAAAAAFALLAGFGMPVRRALFFLIAALAAARRPTRRAQPLALAAALVLAAEPAALFDPGAQLSFAASAALLLARRRRGERGRGGRMRAWLGELLATTALAGLATAPFAAWHFARLAPAALIANLFAVPWVVGVLFPMSLAAALWAWLPEALREARIARGAAERAAALAEASARGVSALADAVPELALAGEPSLATLSVAMLLALIAARVPRLGFRVGLAVAQVVWLALAPAAGIAPPPPRLVALDVGHGDALIVQGREASVLVDAGAAIPDGVDYGRAVVLPALRALGVDALALAVASHADLDHRGGLGAVLRALPVGELWLPAGAHAERPFAALMALARERGVRVRERAAGPAVERFGDLALEVLGPAPRESPASRNDRSLVLRIRAGDSAVLLAGDIERAGEQDLTASGARLAAQVLKLAHHGSRTSSGDAFLARVGAELAIASAPCDGRFGLPHREVRSALRRHGAALAWTGRDGAVLVALGTPRWQRSWNPRAEAECRSRGGPAAPHSAR